MKSKKFLGSDQDEDEGHSELFKISICQINFLRVTSQSQQTSDKVTFDGQFPNFDSFARQCAWKVKEMVVITSHPVRPWASS